MQMDEPTTADTGDAFPGLPRSGDAAFDAFIRGFLRDVLRDAASGGCSQCGAPQGDGTGTLCQGCSDRALLEIASTGGVCEIASDAWSTEGYPTAEHPIWSVLQRELDRRGRGHGRGGGRGHGRASSIDDLYPVLSELHLYETLTVLETDEGQFAFERVTLPFPTIAVERCWLIVWSERSASFLAGTFAGEQREARLLTAVATLTRQLDRR